MPSLNVASLGEYIREQREQAEVSLRQLARSAGVSNPYLSQIERGLKRPSAEILQQIAQGLRISAETLYVRAGLMDERDGERLPGVVAAVTADSELTSRQKRALLDVYEAFRRDNAAAAEVAGGGAMPSARAATAARTATTAPAQDIADTEPAGGDTATAGGGKAGGPRTRAPRTRPTRSRMAAEPGMKTTGPHRTRAKAPRTTPTESA
jgi:transcriptional regulator with XRE-family HTH domain